MIKYVELTIEGLSPGILLHRFPMEEISGLDKKPIAEQAEVAAYRDPDTHGLYFPGINVLRAFIAGATYIKGKGRGSLQKVAAGCLSVSPERLLFNEDEYVIDSRSVVIAATKGRIIRHRPRLDTWKLSLTLGYDDTLISAKQLRELVDATGSRVGLGDFRPAKTGPFGRFVVVAWTAQ